MQSRTHVSNKDICLGAELEDGGDGVEFKVIRYGEILPAFVVRYRDTVYAYVNRCSHMDLKLNFVTDNFFDHDREYLICATHGALYAPESGMCLGGPCGGVGLVPIPVLELDGTVRLSDNSSVTLLNEEQ